MYFEHFRLFYTSDSNKRSIGNHFFKVLVQIHYSQGPSLGGGVVKNKYLCSFVTT